MARPRTKTYRVDAETIIRGLFDADSEESLMLELAACNKFQLIATRRDWNRILWLLVNSFKDSAGSPVFAGERLGEIHKALPVDFR